MNNLVKNVKTHMYSSTFYLMVKHYVCIIKLIIKFTIVDIYVYKKM